MLQHQSVQSYRRGGGHSPVYDGIPVKQLPGPDEALVQVCPIIGEAGILGLATANSLARSLGLTKHWRVSTVIDIDHDYVCVLAGKCFEISSNC